VIVEEFDIFDFQRIQFPKIRSFFGQKKYWRTSFEHSTDDVSTDLDTSKNHNSFDERKRDFLGALGFIIFNNQTSARFFEIQSVFGEVEKHWMERESEILFGFLNNQAIIEVCLYYL